LRFSEDRLKPCTVQLRRNELSPIRNEGIARTAQTVPLNGISGDSMIVSTTPSVEGHRITKYCGVVAGEAILGANLFKDVFAGIRDLVGGRSAVYEGELQKAREIALKELQDRARDLGANAVVGVDLDYEVLGQGNGMLMVSASGTAVVIEA
jgi:uncharacterized protein YbjQ (UPF0145 family)